MGERVGVYQPRTVEKGEWERNGTTDIYWEGPCSGPLQ